MASIASILFFDSVIINLPFFSVGLACRYNPGFATSVCMNHDNDCMTCQCSHADFPDFAVILAVVYTGENMTVKNIFCFIKADAVLFTVITVFVIIPFKFHYAAIPAFFNIYTKCIYSLSII